MNYSTNHLKTLFRVSHTTIQNWCEEFADYLSPAARPEKGRKRTFNDADLAVFALVNELGKGGAGMTFEDIHAMLQTGQRGEIPDTESALVTAALPVALVAARQRVAALETQLAELQLDSGKQITELQAVNHEQAGQIKLLKEMLAEANETIRQLEREAGGRD